MALCPRSLLSPERTESDVLGRVKLTFGVMAALRQPGQVLHDYWASCPSSLGILALEAPAIALTDEHSSRVPSTAIDWISKLII